MEERLSFRPKPIIPEDTMDLQDQLARLKDRLPLTIKCPNSDHEIFLQELGIDWPIKDYAPFAFYVGQIPAYGDELCKVIFVPREVLEAIATCIRNSAVSQEQWDFEQPPNIISLDSF